jgi:ABC-type thiamin/hydroxymethylpyrimidine transport system permease subunit
MTKEKNVDHKDVHSQTDGPDLVPLKAVVAFLWLVAGLVAFIALDRPGIDDINKVVAAPESLAAAAAP